VVDLIETGHGMTVDLWKEMCRSSIKGREELMYRIELCMSEKLTNMYNTQNSLHQWWKVCKAFPGSLKASRFMIKLLVGEEPLAYNRGRYVKPRSIQHQMCKVCNSGALETTEHFLYECIALEESRETFTRAIRELCDNGEAIVALHNSRIVVAAQVDVGPHYLSKLRLIANSIFYMYVQRQHVISLLEANQ
jgi:hypothetical protein